MKKKFALPLVLAAGLLGLVACQGADDSSVKKDGSDIVSMEVDWGTTTESYAIGSKALLDYAQIETLGTIELKVWCAEEVTSVTEAQLSEFKNALIEAGVDANGLTFTVEAQGEGDAASAMITDVEAGADIFCFAQDQLSRLVGASALSELSGTFDTTVRANNDSSSLTAISTTNSNGKSACWAFPLTSDNGYFMYYDKSVLGDDVNLDDLGEIVTACKEAGKTFNYNYSSAWYNMGVVYSNGCVSEWTTNNAGKFESYNDTYNTDEGAAAWKAFYDETWGIDADTISDNSTSSTGFGAKAAAVISGTWDYNVVKEALGDNLGATDLPCYTLDGEEKHLASFSGNKLMGVKPQTDTTKAYAAYLVANYLSGYVGQMGRFESNGWGPSNTLAQADPDVSTPALEALALQGAYATPQGNYPGGWWDLAGAVGNDVRDSGGDLEAIKTSLSNYASNLDAMLNANAPDWANSTVSICGSINSWNKADTTYDLTPNTGATTFTYSGLALEAGAQWQLILNHDWTSQWGIGCVDSDSKAYCEDGTDVKGNITMTVAGTYDISFSTDTQHITITPTEA